MSDAAQRVAAWVRERRGCGDAWSSPALAGHAELRSPAAWVWLRPPSLAWGPLDLARAWLYRHSPDGLSGDAHPQPSRSQLREVSCPQGGLSPCLWCPKPSLTSYPLQLLAVLPTSSPACTGNGSPAAPTLLPISMADVCNQPQGSQSTSWAPTEHPCPRGQEHPCPEVQSIPIPGAKSIPVPVVQSIPVPGAKSISVWGCRASLSPGCRPSLSQGPRASLSRGAEHPCPRGPEPAAGLGSSPGLAEEQGHAGQAEAVASRQWCPLWAALSWEEGFPGSGFSVAEGSSRPGTVVFPFSTVQAAASPALEAVTGMGTARLGLGSSPPAHPPTCSR